LIATLKALAYMSCQIGGAVVGTWAAHLMLDCRCLKWAHIRAASRI
jgi:hypothetical protein